MRFELVAVQELDPQIDGVRAIAPDAFGTMQRMRAMAFCAHAQGIE
jgi:hypothetical protein